MSVYCDSHFHEHPVMYYLLYSQQHTGINVFPGSMTKRLRVKNTVSTNSTCADVKNKVGGGNFKLQVYAFFKENQCGGGPFRALQGITILHSDVPTQRLKFSYKQKCSLVFSCHFPNLIFPLSVFLFQYCQILQMYIQDVQLGLNFRQTTSFFFLVSSTFIQTGKSYATKSH